MKLNCKRTIFVGFAFFLICAFWQAYDAIVPLMLVNKFGLNQTASGMVMAIDNVFALFMLPLFGSLSDKSKSKHGKRTPYIIIGTVLAIVMFIGLSFADNAQLAQIKSTHDSVQFQEQLFEEIKTPITNVEKKNVFSDEVAKEYTVQDYASMIKYNKSYSELSESERTELKDWYKNIKYAKSGGGNASYYYFDAENFTYHYFGDDLPTEEQAKTLIKGELYTNIIMPAMSAHAWQKTVSNPVPLVFFILLLLASLISMAIFRSPAVALMPDVTIKPLRSQANAIINLMGTAGGMLVLVLGMVFGTGDVQKQLGSFTWYIVAVCALMALALAAFITFVREPKWAKEMQDESQRLGLDIESDEVEDASDGQVKSTDKGDNSGMKELIKRDRAKFTSLLLILLSVALWFTGYNAASTKYSLYATNVLHKDYNTTLLIAQAAAIIAYLPAGMLSKKVGRKKSILIGIAVLTCAFFSITFFTAETPLIFINLAFIFGGIGWATINVNSFPMVVELAKGGNVGKYTGYYYTASMSAQIITPILSGLIMDLFSSMTPLFYYSTIFIALSFVSMLFVKHGDAKKEEDIIKNEN